jgi:hypothetical protein
MRASFLVYAGFVVALCGLFLSAEPIDLLHLDTHRRALLFVVVGLSLSAIGFVLPARRKQISRVQSHLDEFVPVWQFDEHHAIHSVAPPERVLGAIKEVRADEIKFFRTLTWIRRGGRKARPSILNAGGSEPLIDVATKSGFVRLGDDSPNELVIGTVVVRPHGWHGPVTAEVIRQGLPPGAAVGALNFIVRPDGQGGTFVSTETRVFANDPASVATFKNYWRLIYPGSAIIRHMWLRAVRARAEAA